jgi:glutamate/aspartate transport system substrate-binding protein
MVRRAAQVARWLILAGAAFSASAFAQEQQQGAVGELTGTLKTIRDTRTIRLGFRESSLPFSYYNKIKQPIGYSIDLCREISEDVATELGGIELKIAFVPVTSANRFDKVKSGEVDLECGSTTSNVQRQKEVAFSPVFFVAGTRLMVPKSSGVKSYLDLAGKTVVVTAGTTNEAALKALSDKQKLAIRIVAAADHARSMATLEDGNADAFATDDVLLYGFIVTDPKAKEMKVVGEFLSYDPYGLVLRKDDPQFTALVERTFQRIAAERRLAELYNKWFTRRLPTGETVNLPISPQLEEFFRILGQPD